MLNNKQINALFGITEGFELPEKLMNILVDKEKREEAFDAFIGEQLDLSHDCLRDYFQNEHAARSELKQDYTPDCICDLISFLIPKTDKIIDICSGTGSLSIGTGRNVEFQCEELSKASIPILLFNLAIRGMTATILQKNVLDKTIEKIFILKKNGKYSDIETVEDYKESKVRAVISNPPYSLPWTPKQDERYEGYPLAPKSAADYAFVLDGINRLDENGTAIYILPSGVLFRGGAEGNIRQQLIENNLIDTVIGLPEKLFLNTSIPVNIIIFKKNRQTKDILFIDSQKLFEKKGKQNILTREHIEKIADVYNNRKTIDKFSYVASFDEIKENEYNLNISRFVDTFVKKEIPPLSEITKDIIKNKIELQKTENELIKMLTELNGDEAYNNAKDEFIKYIKEEDVVGAATQEWLYMQGLEHQADEIFKNAKKERIPVLDIADFERVQQGKVYKYGSVYIQLSATDGVVRYLTEDKELETKYGVFTPKSENLGTRYLYYILEFEMEAFLARYQCGININPDIFKHLQVTYFPETKYRIAIVNTLNNIQYREEYEAATLDGYKEFKEYHLDGMFPEQKRKMNINKGNLTNERPIKTEQNKGEQISIFEL